MAWTLCSTLSVTVLIFGEEVVVVVVVLVGDGEAGGSVMAAVAFDKSEVIFDST